MYALMKLLFSLCAFTLFLSACGQKGPLYLPTPQTKQTTQEKQHGL